MIASQIVYRSATIDDAGEMIAVHYASVHSIPSGHYHDDILAAWSPSPDEHRRKWLADLVANDSTVCELATAASGRVIGFGIALPEQSKLQALYISPEYSGLGIGARLLFAVEARCKDFGADSLELNASYNAVNFYCSKGYASIRETTQPLTDGLEMGAVFMSKCLAKAV